MKHNGSRVVTDVNVSKTDVVKHIGMIEHDNLISITLNCMSSLLIIFY